MKVRLFAMILETPIRPRTRHLVGLPPDLTGGTDARVSLPWPHVVILEQDPEGGVSLERYSRDGEFAGDTWHMSVEDAKHQAEIEYGDGLGKWTEVPEEVDDVLEFALSEAR
jgi:hypothetical protein